jgi:hypothetical protein
VAAGYCAPVNIVISTTRGCVSSAAAALHALRAGDPRGHHWYGAGSDCNGRARLCSAPRVTITPAHARFPFGCGRSLTDHHSPGL